jgi:hypothetical protein
MAFAVPLLDCTSASGGTIPRGYDNDALDVRFAGCTAYPDAGKIMAGIEQPDHGVV